MTTQPRGIGGPYPQSSSQPIPTAHYANQPQFGHNQAYSPRPVPPSSSPLTHQYYQGGPPHEMFKGPGVAGTPPGPMMMPQPQFYMNGQRQRVSQMAPVRGQQMYYPMVQNRFPNVPQPGGPTQQFYHHSPQATVSQYPTIMQHTPTQMTQQQAGPIYGQPGYPPQFSQPPPGPPLQSSMPQGPPVNTMVQSQQSSGKRERKIIRIRDPNTNMDVTDDLLRGGQRQESISTPPSGRLSATPPTSGDNNVAAKFAAQVAAAAGTKNASQLTQVSDPHAVPINPSPQLMPQDQAIVVGSPISSGQMHSPRPVLMQQHNTYVPPSMQATVNHQSVPSRSPGPVVNQSQMQINQVNLQPNQLQEHTQPAAYQMPSQPQTQQFVTPPIPIQHPTMRPSPNNIPEDVFPAPVQTIAAPVSPIPVPVKAASPIANHSQLPQQHSAAAPVADQKNVPEDKAPVMPPTAETSISSSSLPVQQDSPVTAEPKQQTPNIQQKCDDGAIPMATVQSEAAPTDQKTVVADIQAENTQQEVPPAPENSNQALEKEDTAIRLGDKSDSSPVVTTETSQPPSEVAKPEVTQSKADKSAAQNDMDTPPSEGSSSVVQPNKESSKVPPVKIDPSMSNSEANETESKDEVTPIPSAKAVSDKTDSTSELQDSENLKLAEKQAVTESPEPTESEPTEPKKAKSNVKDSSLPDSSNPTKGKTATVLAEQKSSEKPAINGITSDTSIESEPSPKSKASDVPPSPKSKVADSKNDGKAKNTSRSSDKAASDKPDSGKANGVSGKSKSVQEIKYIDEEQWSPGNPQGKRQYDSNFLLQFQYRPASLSKPNDLPNIDCVLELPHNKIATPMQPMEFRPGGSDFIPNFLRGSGPRRGPGRQNSRDHRPVRTPGPKKVVSIDRDVELKTTANAWKPTRRDANANVTQDEKETLEIVRNVRAILNKLTPSTFKNLMQQVLSLKIDTEKKLRGTIDLIFEKAIDEPNFSEAYANMCRQMTTIRVTPEENPDQSTPIGQVEFRKLLLTKCQREFEKNKSDQEHLLELRKKMEANTDTELAPQLKEEYDTAEFKERRRTLGNIRFIGELFKLKMLTESIMHNCIMSLFKAKDDDHLESLCRLLTTIGKDLDHVKGKQRMDQYFDQIRKTIQEKRTSARVRFMLQDVDDLRSNNWVPRAIQTQGPKTISQIHQDAKQEQEMLQLKLATTPTAAPMKQGNRGQNRMGSRGHGEDGWTKVPSTPKPTRFDPNKMKLMKPSNIDESKVTLGPSRGFGGWKSGSAGSGITRTGSSGYSPSGSMDKTQESVGRSNTPTSMMNRFSALSQGAQGSDYDYQRRHGGRQGSREGSRTGSRGSMGPPSSSSSGGHTPRRDERTLLLETTRKLTSNDRPNESRQKSSRESSPSVPRQPRSATPKQTEPAHKYNTDLDEDRMQTKSKNILEEFLNIVDFKEATECLEELNAPPTLMYAMVYIAHEFTLEKKKEARTNIGKLMAHLLKRGRLSVEQYVKGLSELLEMATDVEIDVPKVWEYLAEQLAPVFADDNDAEISISRVGELATPLQEENKSGVFVAEVVKAVIREGSLQSFIARWQRSNLSWSKILLKDADTVRSFLKKHNLEDLADSDSSQQMQGAVPTTLSQGKSSKANEQYCLEIELTKLLENACTNEEIFEWVDKNLKGEDMTGPAFLRALTISICKRSVATDATVTVNEDKISERSILLKKYVDTQPERELQVLYALQHLMVDLDQPANVLRKFFDVFYNEDIVQEQSFYKWEESKDPNEQEGKGIAIASVNPFFTWLRTAEAESD